MRRTPAKRFLFPLSMVFGLLAATLCSSVFADPVEYTGMSDASAGVALSEHLFVAANDDYIRALLGEKTCGRESDSGSTPGYQCSLVF